MLSGFTAAAIITQGTTFFSEISTAVLVVAGCLIAFAVGRYALHLLKRVAR